MQMEKNMNNQDSARVRAWLEQGVLLFDGATGTALRAQAEEGEAVERLCLTQPQRVSALHRGYLAAGCGRLRPIRLRHTCQWPAKMKRISVD